VKELAIGHTVSRGSGGTGRYQSGPNTQAYNQNTLQIDLMKKLEAG
jgi:hypothetical protein